MELCEWDGRGIRSWRQHLAGSAMPCQTTPCPALPPIRSPEKRAITTPFEPTPPKASKWRAGSARSSSRSRMSRRLGGASAGAGSPGSRFSLEAARASAGGRKRQDRLRRTVHAVDAFSSRCRAVREGVGRVLRRAGGTGGWDGRILLPCRIVRRRSGRERVYCGGGAGPCVTSGIFFRRMEEGGGG